MPETKNNIYIIIGTKAQLIKMAPVMIELKKKNIPYTFIFTGQHKETIKEPPQVFKLKKPEIVPYKYMPKVVLKVQKVVAGKIKLFGSENKI